MVAVLRTIAGSIRGHAVLWVLLTLAFTGLYFAGLLLTLIVRFGALPNYVVVYDLAQAYGNIVAGTPAWSDMLPILVAEPAFEVGFRNPDYYNIAEWSLMVVPNRALVIVVLGALLATYTVIRRDGRRVCPAHRPGETAAAGAGTALMGLAMATVTWVVCCATPSWVVILAMLGLGSTLALALEPLGWGLAALGLALLAGAILTQARRLAAVPATH